jgi:hypothetical protein
MSVAQRFHVYCFDPTHRWPGRLCAALDSAQWRVVKVDSYQELLATSDSGGVLPCQFVSPPALLLCVMDETNAAEIARWWSLNRERVNPRSPLIVVLSSADNVGFSEYWQELGATAVLTTTLEIPFVLQLAASFATTPDNRAIDAEHPLTPFWQQMPWSDALPKAGFES